MSGVKGLRSYVELELKCDFEFSSRAAIVDHEFAMLFNVAMVLTFHCINAISPNKPIVVLADPERMKGKELGLGTRDVGWI